MELTLNQINTENYTIQHGGARSEKKFTTGKYKRPEKTFQDLMTPEQIMEKLEGFHSIPSEEIYEVPLETYVRYFTIVNGEKKFRIGGRLSVKEPTKKYIMLTSDIGKRFSVQVNNNIEFWVQDNENDMIEQYKTQIDALQEKIKEYNKYIKKSENVILNYQKTISEQKKMIHAQDQTIKELQAKLKKLKP